MASKAETGANEQPAIDPALLAGLPGFPKKMTKRQKEARRLMKEARAYEKQGELSKAIKKYTRAIQQDASNSKTYLLRGAAYERKKRFNKAIADFTMASEMDENNPKVFTMRARAYTGAGKYEHAIADNTRAILIDPDYSTAYDHRGIAKYHLHRIRGAIHDFKRAIKHEKKYVNAYFHLAHALKRYGKDEEAEQALHRAKKLAGLDATVTPSDWPSVEDSGFHEAMRQWRRLTGGKDPDQSPDGSPFGDFDENRFHITKARDIAHSTSESSDSSSSDSYSSSSSYSSSDSSYQYSS